MAALYLHNPSYISDPSESSSRSRLHSRTLSSGTLRTYETQNSHPSEPLLPRDISSTTRSTTNQAHLSHPDGTGRDWDMRSISLDGGPTSITREKPAYWEHYVRRRLRVWKASKRALEIVLALWAVYNAVRYFIAYTVYSSMDGQTFALALGCTTAVSFAFFVCDGILAVLQTRLVAAHTSIRFLLILRSVFLFLASFFVFSASIVNLVVTIIWRSTRSAELSADHRCHLDVDVVWSVYPPKATCQSSNRKVWIGLAALRVALTLLLAVSLLFTTARYNVTRRPSQFTCRPHRRRRRRRKGERNYDSSTLVGSAISPSDPATSLQQASSSNGKAPAFPRPPLRPSSRSRSISSRAHDRRSWPASTSSSGGDIPSPSPDPLQDRCDTSLDDERCLDPDLSLSQFDPALVQQRITDAIYLSPSAASQLPDPFAIRDDRELHNFVDRFRMLVSQITRETEDALEYARSEPYVTEREVESDDEDESDEGHSQWHYPYHPPPPLPPAALGFDEFGRPTPYPPDDHVRILNQFVRRMPTIESLGSRELGSITSSMGRIDGERMTNLSIHTLSRPPTRTMTDFGGSEPPSRAATPAVSLSLNMAVVSGTGGGGGGSSSTYGSPQTPKTPSFRSVSDMGEVPIDKDESSMDSEFGVRQTSSRGSGSGIPQLSHSRSSFFSFHTANSGGTGTLSSPTSESFASPKSSPNEDTHLS